MKLSIAIGDTHASPRAFVVYRGFEQCVPKAAALGYHGLELALKRADEVSIPRLQRLTGDYRMEVSCISTGQVYADGNLKLTHENNAKREEVKSIFREFIDLAAQFGQIVNIGRVRGEIGGRPRQEVENIFVEVTRDLCAYALSRSVTLILEPVNRYEIDFVNTVEEGASLLKKIDMPNLMLMPDTFHMNIEDRVIGPELAKHIGMVKYIHFADSNRHAPGQGHIDFEEIFNSLLQTPYDGWISVEILPRPDPDTAAKQAAQFLLPRISLFNRLRKNGTTNFKEAVKSGL